MLDATIILKAIWEYYEGKYVKVDGINRWCKKDNIVPVSWEYDINNDIGRSRVPTSMKTLNKDYCDNIYNCFGQHAVKLKVSGVSVA